MRDAEIERLLGGYATNTLTASERGALFEAALNDQQLFNALQDEQALRDLLDDTASRRVIQQALRDAAPEPSGPWFTQRWSWSLASAAMAAGAIIFVLLPSKQTPQAQTQVAVLRSDSPAPLPATPVRAGEKPELPQPRAALHSQPKAVSKAIQPPAQATIPELKQQIAQLQTARQFDRVAAEQAAPVPVAPAAASFRAGAAGGYVNASAVASASIPYSVLKRGVDGSYAPISSGDELQEGDSVRLMLHPQVSGFLNLQQASPGGNWTNLFPEAKTGLYVTANQDVAVPDAAIPVKGVQQLRLVLNTAEPPGSIALRRAAKTALSQPKARMEKELPGQDSSAGAADVQIAPRTLVTNVTLAPGKAPVR